MPATINSATLSPELEAIASAAADRVRATAQSDTPDLHALDHRVREAASAAIAAGAPLGAIAAAEQHGQAQAREQLGPELLKAITKAAKRKHDAEHDYEHAIKRAGRLGLAHREIAAAAEVAHGTIRTILTRTDNTLANGHGPSANGDSHNPEPHNNDSNADGSHQ